MSLLSKDDTIRMIKTKLINKFCTERLTVDDSIPSLPPIYHASSYKLDYLFSGSRSYIKTLKTDKAACSDYIDNRLLKELSWPLSGPLNYLCCFFFTYYG